jgi:hypothetical protein
MIPRLPFDDDEAVVGQAASKLTIRRVRWDYSHIKLLKLQTEMSPQSGRWEKVAVAVRTCPMYACRTSQQHPENFVPT